MSAAEVQAFVARLYVDDPFRRLFWLEPDPLLDGYKLSAEERADLARLDREGVERFARSLKQKRLRRVTSAFPLLFGLGHPDLLRYYDRFYQLHPDDPAESLLQQALKLGRFLEESLRFDPDLPPYAGELARYECWRLAATLETESAPEDSTETLLPDCIPVLRPGVRAGMFRWDLARIVRSLREGKEPDAGTPGKHGLLFLKSPSKPSPTVLRATPETVALLELCDGARTAAGVVAAYERDAGETGLRREVFLALSDLRDQHALRMLPPGSVPVATGQPMSDQSEVEH